MFRVGGGDYQELGDVHRRGHMLSDLLDSSFHQSQSIFKSLMYANNSQFLSCSRNLHLIFFYFSASFFRLLKTLI